MALEGQGHMAAIDTMTEALYKRVQAMGGNFPTDEEVETAVGGKDYVKVSDELTESIKDGDLVIGGGGSGGGSNTVYIDFDSMEDGYVSNLTGKQIIDAYKAGKTFAARRGSENEYGAGWTYLYLVEMNYYTTSNELNIKFIGSLVPEDPMSALQLWTLYATMQYTDERVTFTRSDKEIK
jgi:hypothetical protein